MGLKAISLRTKLLVAFGFCAAISLIVGLVGFFNVKKLGDALYEVGVVRLPSIQGLALLDEAQTSIERTAIILLSKDLTAESRHREYQDISSKWIQAEKGWKIYEPLPQTKEEARLWTEFIPAWTAWKADVETFLNLSSEYDSLQASGTTPATLESQHAKMAEQASVVCNKSYGKTAPLLDQIIALNYKVADQAKLQSVTKQSDVIFFRRLIFFFASGAVTLSILLGLVVTHSITRPVQKLVAGLEKIARGNLTVRVPVESDDEIGKLSAAANQMAEALGISKQRLSLATRAAGIGIWDWDVVSNKLAWDEWMYQLYGIEKKDFSGAYEAWEKTLAPEDRVRVAAKIQAALRGEGDFSGEYRIVWPDGSIHYLQVESHTIRDTEDKPLRMVGLNYDITKRKQAEEQIDMLRQTIDAHPDGAYWFGTDGRLVYVNEGGCRNLGYARDELSGCFLSQISPRATPERLAQLWQEIKISGFHRLESFHRRKDGTEFPVEITATYVQIGGKEYTCGFSRNITERKQAERALQESETKYRRLHETMTDAFVQVDLTGRIQDCNPAYRELLGYSEAELLQLSYVDLTPGKWHAMEAAITHDQILRQGYSRVYEKEYRRKDGTVFPIELRTFLLRDENQQPSAMWAIVRDITERKRMENEMRTLLETAPVGIMRIRNRRIVGANARLSEMLGYERDELLGSEVLRFFDDRDQGSAIIQEAVALLISGRSVTAELPVRRKDGTIIDVLAGISPVEPNNIDEGSVGVLMDISAKKQAETLRHAKGQAEAANRAKTVFLANMSHEIRTPMNAILGFAQLMLRDPLLSPTQREHLAIIDRNGGYLLTLLNDVLEMSKIEAQRTTLKLSSFSLTALVRDLQSIFAARAGAKEIRLLFETPSLLPARVLGDEGKLRQIFINLLGNAIKFTDVGQVTLRLKTLPHDALHWLIQAEIEDTGPGIGASEMDRLFQQFEQTETGRKTGLGTGLGLAISREFARLMSGDITVRSEPGKGCVFALTILVEIFKEEDHTENVSTGHVLRLATGQPPCRVLIVDDQQDNRLLLVELLQKIGFETRAATNGAEAVEAFAQWTPHAILMDLRMPVMDGSEATRRIRTLDTKGQTKIIGLSASVIRELQEPMPGVDIFLGKPFRDDDLLETLGTALNLHYDYEERRVSTPSADLSKITDTLPSRFVEPLRQALTTADLDNILVQLAELEQEAPALAAHMRTFAANFDWARIAAMLPASPPENAP